MLLGLGGCIRYESVEALYFFLFSAYLSATNLLYTVLEHRQPSRVLTVVTWFGGISLAIVVALFSPMFLSLSLLCIVSTVLHAISRRQTDRSTLLAGSVVMLASVVAVMVIAEWSSFHGHFLELRFFTDAGADLALLLHAVDAAHLAERAPMIVESAFRIPLTIGFSLSILQLLWNFYNRIESNVARLQRSNQELVVAQQELQQRLLERTQLLEISRSVSSTQDFQSLLTNTLVQLKTVVDYGRATVLLMRGDDLGEISSIGHLPNLSSSSLVHVIFTHSGLQSLADMREAVLIDDARPYGMRGSHLIVPLIVRGRFIGLLTIRHATEHFYGRRAGELCMAFANQVAGIIDSAQLQQSATDALITAERNRLARELHDSVSQSLFGIVLGTRTALEQIESSPEAARTALLYSVDLAAAALAEMRALIFTMRPETLEQHGLIAALQNQIDLLRPHHAVQIQLIKDGDEPDASLDVKEALYRIAVEALQNAIRHAACSTILIRLFQDEKCIGIEILDDGRGFDATIDYAGHLGLKTMRERAFTFAGTLTIDSAPGRGTRVTATLPTAGSELRRPMPDGLRI